MGARHGCCQAVDSLVLKHFLCAWDAAGPPGWMSCCGCQAGAAVTAAVAACSRCAQQRVLALGPRQLQP